MKCYHWNHGEVKEGNCEFCNICKYNFNTYTRTVTYKKDRYVYLYYSIKLNISLFYEKGMNI